MHLVTLPILFVALIALQFTASFSLFSLCNFSFDGLDRACRRKVGRTAFITRILDRQPQAVLTCGIVLILLLITSSSIAVLIVQELARTGEGSMHTVEVAVLLAGLICVQIVSLLLSRALAEVHSERWLAVMFPWLDRVTLLMSPLLGFAGLLTRFVQRFDNSATGSRFDIPPLVRGIFSSLAGTNHDLSSLLKTRDLVQRVIALSKSDAADIMTTRDAIVSLVDSVNPDEARRILLESGYSRIPVLGQTPDDVLGILHAKDLLGRPANSQLHTETLASLCRKPLFVPEITALDTLLATMQRQQVHMAIVLDEYGGVSGLVTTEDILEEIVGEIADEFDRASDDGITLVSDRCWLVDGRVHVDELNERLGLNLPNDEDFDTIAGYVYMRTGRIPRDQETLELDALRFTIGMTDAYRIESIRIEQPDQNLDNRRST